jgi:hypothetical protein
MAQPQDLLHWLQDTRVAEAVAEADLLFPAIETIHVLALAVVVGTILRVDWRLIGLGVDRRPITLVARQMLKLTWGGFAVAVVSGGLLFVSNAVRYFDNPAFRVKLVLLLLLGLNMVVFQRFTWRAVRPADIIPRRAVRLAGATSMVLWISVVAAGRWIGFLVH